MSMIQNVGNSNAISDNSYQRLEKSCRCSDRENALINRRHINRALLRWDAVPLARPVRSRSFHDLRSAPNPTSGHPPPTLLALADEVIE
jgi:hypothetical protein